MLDHPVLSRLAHTGMRLGLSRLRPFLATLGNPHLGFPVVHIAGTNGKGSVVRMLDAMLRSHGLKVGAYISPHLQQVNERISVGGIDIDDDTLGELLEKIDAERRAWTAREGFDPDPTLTYFEMMTAAAFVHFTEQKVDVAVIEVGLGGRLDATNIVPKPLVTAITSIGIDHTEVLGDDLASIAAEKAGIVKQGVPLVVGPLPPPAFKVVRAVAADKGAELYVRGKSYRVQGKSDDFAFSFGETALRGMATGLHGDHQVDNAGVALMVAHLLPEPFRPSEDAMRRGLRMARNPGRNEWLAPDLLVDCAHNADGAAQLAAYLRQLPRDRRRTLLLGVSNDKDVRAIVAVLAPTVDRVVCTRCNHPRAADPKLLAQTLVDIDVPVSAAGPIEEALPQALDGEGLVIAAGSVFLAGAVRDILGAR
jgi:dihydrofolate synthase / folylpolyglutamate synthase